MRHVSASKYWLARNCLHPWSPEMENRWLGPGGKPEAVTGWSGRLGSYAHKLLECHITGTTPSYQLAADYRTTPRMRELAAACFASGLIYLSSAPEHRRAEVPFRLHAGTATELFITGRKYPALPGLYGTADLVASGGSAVLAVADWKTGLAVAPYTEHARWQIRWLGVAAWQASGSAAETVKLDAVYLRKDGKRPWVQGEARGRVDMQELVDDVGRTQERQSAGSYGPVPGPHCAGCPVRRACKEAVC